MFDRIYIMDLHTFPTERLKINFLNTKLLAIFICKEENERFS